jgi:cytidyltransferase-like protein
MIVSTEELPRLRGVVSMVDGGFDPIHAGHIAYFREAGRLGLPVLCNVSPDEWVARKHVPLLPHAERVEIIDSIRYIDYTHASRTTTEEVLRRLEPRYYLKGADWRGRLPEREVAVCEECGIEVVYLDTVVGSSSAILERYEAGARQTSTGA